MNRLAPLALAALLLGGLARADEIHDAAKAGDVARLQAILAADPAQRDAPGERGLTPLHDACAGQVEAAKLLIAAGADVNARSANGATPLYVAARFGQAELIRLLLERGADPNSGGEGGIPLHQAVYRGGPEALALLLAAGSAVNAKDAQGDAPLHVAAVWGSPDAARALLEKGADVRAVNAAGETPLHALSRLFPGSSDSLDVARLLLAKGAPRDARNAAGQTPAEQAAAKGAAELAALLAPPGATPP